MATSQQDSPPLTPDQSERHRQLVRFNRLTLYLPLAILALFVVSITGLMFWLTLFSDGESIEEWRQFSSATADIVIILTVLPMILFAAVFPILAAAWFWYTWETPRPVESWLQKWLRKTDSFVGNSAEKVGTASSAVAEYSIKYRASTTRISHVFEKMASRIFRKEESKTD